MKPYGFVYLTTNKQNGKKYIGKKALKGEWRTYLGSGVILKNAIKKYGVQWFSREILAFAYSSEELNELEKKYIREYNAIESEDFYNLASGGDGGNAHAGFSEERKKQFSAEQSERSKIINSRPEVKKKIRDTHKGRRKSEKHREKMRAAYDRKTPRRHIRVRSIFNGEAIEFKSIKECSNYFSINIHTARKILKSGEPYKSNPRNELIKHLDGLRIERVI